MGFNSGLKVLIHHIIQRSPHPSYNVMSKQHTIMLYDREFVFIVDVNNGEKITHIFTIILFRDGTVVGTPSTLRLGQPQIPGSIPANRDRILFFYESVQIGCALRPVSSLLGSESPSDIRRPVL
jgi:hypothetical protein